MRNAILSLLLVGSALCAADPVAEFKAAMADNDASRKKTAIAALASGGDDDVILPLLIQAVADRQGSDPAIRALRQRTGLTPPARKGGSSYPGYPTTDDAAGWNTWLKDRTKDKETAAELKKLKDDAAKKDGSAPADPAAAGSTPADPAAAQPGAAPVPVAAQELPDDLGKLDRIVLKRGGSFLAYVRSKRTDADGRLVSVRIVHVDNQGEETLPADLISRIDEDVP